MCPFLLCQLLGVSLRGPNVIIKLIFNFISRNNTKSSSQQSSSSSSSSSLSLCSSSSTVVQEVSQQATVVPESDSNSQVDWTYDPNEPRYCICNQVKVWCLSVKVHRINKKEDNCSISSTFFILANIKNDLFA